MKKQLPIAVQDFKEMITDNYYYVDKTKFIEEIFTVNGKVKLFTRPRRFGKTLNMSMLDWFFNIENAKENRELFKGLYIENSPVFEEQGQYPVIFISMKDVDGDTYEVTIERLRNKLHFLYGKFYFIRETLDNVEKKLFDNAYDPESKKDIANALLNLSVFLKKYYNKKVMVLVDEYDAPLLAAYKNGYYEKAVKFFRTFYSSILKNDYATLEKAVLTGITKVSQTGIFSGLNNIKTYTILMKDYDEYFGLLESEVVEALEYYEMVDTLEQVKFWYDGYRFGNVEVYNPWSIFSYLESKELDSYWGKTSGDFKIKEYLKNIGKTFLDDLEALLSGKTISVTVSEDTPLNDSNMEKGNFWQLMLFAGYVTTVEKKSRGRYEVRLPNKEVKNFFEVKFIEIIFQSEGNFNSILDNLENRNIEEIIKEIKENLVSMISFIDVAKNHEYAYHLFCAGMMSGAKASFVIKSNPESGDGIPDLTLRARDPKKHPSYIFEFKRKGESSSSLEKLAKEGLKQIIDKRYDTNFLAEGISAEDIIKIGISFDGKKAEAVYQDGIEN